MGTVLVFGFNIFDYFLYGKTSSTLTIGVRTDLTREERKRDQNKLHPRLVQRYENGRVHPQVYYIISRAKIIDIPKTGKPPEKC